MLLRMLMKRDGNIAVSEMVYGSYQQRYGDVLGHRRESLLDFVRDFFMLGSPLRSGYLIHRCAERRLVFNVNSDTDYRRQIVRTCVLMVKVVV